MAKKMHLMNIGNVISDIRNARKMEQFLTLQDICFTMTSDDFIEVKCELYDNNVVRYLIYGTRCNMTLTYNALTQKTVRKSRKARPWHTEEFKCRCDEILEYANIPEGYKVKCYDIRGNLVKEVKTDTLKEAEQIRTEHGLRIGLEPEPTYKDFSKYPTIWVYHTRYFADGTTDKGYERLSGY